MRTIPALLLLAALAAAPALVAAADGPQGGNGSPPPSRPTTDYLGSGLVPKPGPTGLPEGGTIPSGGARPLPIPSRMTTSSLRVGPGEAPSTAQPTKALPNRGSPPALPPKPEAGLVPPTRKAVGRGGPLPPLAPSSSSPSSPSISSPVISSSAASEDGTPTFPECQALSFSARKSRHAMSLKPDEARQLHESFSALSPLGPSSSVPSSSSSSAPSSSSSAVDEEKAKLQAELEAARCAISHLNSLVQRTADDLSKAPSGAPSTPRSELSSSSSSLSSSGGRRGVNPKTKRERIAKYTGDKPFWQTLPTIGGTNEKTKNRVAVEPNTWRRAACTQENAIEVCGEHAHTGLICGFNGFGNKGRCVKPVGDLYDLCVHKEFVAFTLDSSYAIKCGKGMACRILDRSLLGRVKAVFTPYLTTCQHLSEKEIAKLEREEKTSIYG